MKSFLICSILLVLAAISSAQDNSETKIIEEKEDEVITELSTENGKTYALAKIRSFIEFSKSKKETLFLFSTVIRSAETPQLFLMPTLNFYSRTPECKYPQKLDFDILFKIDDEEIKMNSVPKNAKQDLGSAMSLSEMEGDTCNESIFINLPQQTFLKFGQAKKITVSFGSVIIKLKDSNVQSLQKLVNYNFLTKNQ